MRKRLQIALAAALLIILFGVAVWQVLGPCEPIHQGKPLSAWLAALDLETSHSPEAAMHAVRAIGTNSFPWLTRMLRAKDPVWKRAVIWFNAKQSFLLLPATPASVVQNRAVQAYIALGSAAKDNVPALIQIMESESSPQVRACVAAALGGIGPEAKGAIPVLLKASADNNAEVRKNSICALANIHRWSPNDPAERSF